MAMRTLIAIAAFLALATGAQAYCVAVPDTAETGYSKNNVDRALCLQGELTQSTNQQAYRTQVDAMLEQLQRNALQQRLQLQQLQTQLNTPSYLLPKF